MTNYQQAKSELKQFAKQIKDENDKPRQRMCINDYCDALCKAYHFTEYYRNLLCLYSLKFHPKK